jgi:enoyl-CoA hydratase/carnithine racemase
MSTVRFNKKDGMGTITLNDPDKMNGLSEPLVTKLLKILDAAEKDRDIKVIILTGQ